MRKSTKNNDIIAGNKAKYETYREAWARIGQAQRDQYFLEAIALEESIISDRLFSYLARPDSPNPLTNSKRRLSFNALIEKLDNESNEPVAAGGFDNLCDSLFKWKDKRNNALHAFAKSDPGSPTPPIDSFLEELKITAEEGALLARAVTNWHKAQKRNS